MTKIRFQADADLRQAIVTGAIRREPNLDFRSANEAGLEGIKDPEVLALSARRWQSIGYARSQNYAEGVWSVYDFSNKFRCSDSFSESSDWRSN